MAVEFVPETGAGLATATSYVTIAEFKQYWENRGVSFTALDPVIQTWLNIGTDYIDNYYKFWGVPTLPETQALQFPRIGLRDSKNIIIDSDVIPTELKNALCVMAREAKTTLDLSSKVDTGIASKSIGPVSVTYRNSYKVDYKNATAYLKIFIKNGAGLQVVS